MVAGNIFKDSRLLSHRKQEVVLCSLIQSWKRRSTTCVNLLFEVGIVQASLKYLLILTTSNWLPTERAGKIIGDSY